LCSALDLLVCNAVNASVAWEEMCL